MIYDCFTFFNENDVLDIRLQELYPVVDRFVIVQSNYTFRGNPKPDYFDYRRFQKYMDKVELLVVNPDVPNGEPSLAWEREAKQRNGILFGLSDAKPDDIIIISDADEIPRRSVIEGIEPDGVVSLALDVYCVYINWLTPNDHTVKVCRFKDFTTAQEVRKAPRGLTLPHAGWEFSSLTTPEGISHKLGSFSHFELDNTDINDVNLIRDRIMGGFDPYGFGLRYTPVEIDDTWPEAIKNNREYWRKFEWTP